MGQHKTNQNCQLAKEGVLPKNSKKKNKLDFDTII